MTTLTQADVDGGMTVGGGLSGPCSRVPGAGAAVGQLRRLRPQAVRANCGEFGIPYPFGPTHLNVKTLAAVAYGWSREVGMGEALKRMGLPLEGTHHRGGDDAWNIAAILSRVLRSGRAGRVWLASTACGIAQFALATSS